MLTILTPTYNRANKLNNLYQSLQAQTDKNFEWLVVDDGSSDNTKSFIDKISQKSAFTIRYIYKENGGKHTALNVGIKEIENDLTFIVDSDDTLTADAVEQIAHYYNKYKNKVNDICGFSFLRQYPDCKINGTPFLKDEWKTDHITARINSGDFNSDKAEVFLTDSLKEFPFPEFKGEKFLGEDLVWLRMARKYDFIYINKPIYISDYLDDGLTKNRRVHNINSPIGCTERAKEFLHSDIKLKYRIKPSLQYLIYGKFAGKKISELIKDSPEPFLSFLSILPSEIIYLKWKRENS